jgi:hypothetical protein
MNLIPKDMLKELGVSSLPEAEQKDALEKIGRTLVQAVLVKSLDILSIEEEEELDKIMDKDKTTTNDILAFLASKIPTFSKLVKDERNNLKEELVYSTK